MNQRKSLPVLWWPATGLVLSGCCLVAAARPALGHCSTGRRSRTAPRPIGAAKFSPTCPGAGPSADSHEPTHLSEMGHRLAAATETWERSLLQVARERTASWLNKGWLTGHYCLAWAKSPACGSCCWMAESWTTRIGGNVDRCPSLEHLRLRHSPSATRLPPTGPPGTADSSEPAPSRLTQVGISTAGIAATAGVAAGRLAARRPGDRGNCQAARPDLLHLIGPQLTDRLLSGSPRLRVWVRSTWMTARSVLRPGNGCWPGGGAYTCTWTSGTAIAGLRHLASSWNAGT